MANPNVSALIAGELYQITSGKYTINDCDCWYMEYLSTDELIRGSRFIHNKNLSSTYHHWGSPDCYTFTRIDKSEIQHLLPAKERKLIINSYEIY